MLLKKGQLFYGNGTAGGKRGDLIFPVYPAMLLKTITV
jgi:hypothetical protein